MTKIKSDVKKPPQAWVLEASAIVAKAYVEPQTKRKSATWDEAINAIHPTATVTSKSTLTAYRKAVRILRETLDANRIKTNGPADITEELAERFFKIYVKGVYSRSHAEDATEYNREAVTIKFVIAQLSAVWGKQFVEDGLVKSNVWKPIRKLAVSHVVKSAEGSDDEPRKPAPTDEAIATFFEYVKTRYPQWKALHAFFELKALSGCRLEDICSLESSQAADGFVSFRANQTKNKKARKVKTPETLFATLSEVSGDSYLWQGIVDGLSTFRRSKRHKGYGNPQRTVYHVAYNIFREFSEAHPEHAMSSHAFRRWALTKGVSITGSIDATAYQFGVTAKTIRANYLDPEKAFKTAQTWDAMAKAPPTNPPTNKPNKPEQ
jgi:integrase